MKEPAGIKRNVSSEFDVFKALIAQIEEGGCLTELMNWMLYDRCENLMEDAEIYTALHPEHANQYLLERRLAIYTLLICMPKRKLELKQKEQLLAIEHQLFGLYGFYSSLYRKF